MLKEKTKIFFKKYSEEIFIVLMFISIFLLYGFKTIIFLMLVMILIPFINKKERKNIIITEIILSLTFLGLLISEDTYKKEYVNIRKAEVLKADEDGFNVKVCSKKNCEVIRIEKIPNKKNFLVADEIDYYTIFGIHFKEKIKNIVYDNVEKKKN